MHESLAPWTTFYTITGSAAATLTGLMFVTITLVTGMRVNRPLEGIAAFSTPTIVHYCIALAVAANLSAPWHTLWHAGLMLGLIGLGGLAYSTVVVRRLRVQGVYNPVLEDRLWHVIFPLVSYVALVVAAVLLADHTAATLFIAAGATILLLFIGIHNAWDNVTYLVVNYSKPSLNGPDEGHGATAPAAPSGGEAHSVP